jgi:hypothetical protein
MMEKDSIAVTTVLVCGCSAFIYRHYDLLLLACLCVHRIVHVLLWLWGYFFVAKIHRNTFLKYYYLTTFNTIV